MAAPDTVYRYYTNLKTKDSNGNVLNIRTAKPLLSYTDVNTFKDKFKLSGVLKVDNPIIPSSDDSYDAGDSNRNGIIGFVKADNSDGMAEFHDIRTGSFGSDQTSKDYSTRTKSRAALARTLDGVECIVLNDAGLNRRGEAVFRENIVPPIVYPCYFYVKENKVRINGYFVAPPYNQISTCIIRIIKIDYTSNPEVITSYDYTILSPLGQGKTYPATITDMFEFKIPITDANSLMFEAFSTAESSVIRYSFVMICLNEEGTWSTPLYLTNSYSTQITYCATPGYDEWCGIQLESMSGTNPPSEMPDVTQTQIQSAYNSAIEGAYYSKEFNGLVSPVTYPWLDPIGRNLFATENANSQFENYGLYIRSSEKPLTGSIPYYFVYKNESTGITSIVGVGVTSVTDGVIIGSGSTPITYYFADLTVFSFDSISLIFTLNSNLYAYFKSDSSVSVSYRFYILVSGTFINDPEITEDIGYIDTGNDGIGTVTTTASYVPSLVGAMTSTSYSLSTLFPATDFSNLGTLKFELYLESTDSDRSLTFRSVSDRNNAILNYNL